MKYPKNLREFERQFATEEQCRDYLLQLHFPNGYKCPKCGHTEYWKTARGKYQCADCGSDFSVMAGTIFQGSHTPLTTWFRAIWQIVTQKTGISANNLKSILGIGSYETAWLILHKVRRAMVRPNRDKIRGVVEVDETYIGGASSGKRGRGAQGKALVAIAVEVHTDGSLGRIRLEKIQQATSAELLNFINNSVAPNSEIVTDGWQAYNDVTGAGYRHTVNKGTQTNAENLLPHVHMVISLLKRWLLGTLQGACSKDHLEHYLDEYAFRFNRRNSKSRGLLFQRVLENAVQVAPSTYDEIIA